MTIGGEFSPTFLEITMPSTDLQLDRKIKQKIQEPKQWRVILLNDDHTPMDFVIDLLMEIFDHTYDQAETIMLQIHELGAGIAGIYSFEIAETKAVEATNTARSANFPLQIKIEED